MRRQGEARVIVAVEVESTVCTVEGGGAVDVDERTVTQSERASGPDVGGGEETASATNV